MSGFAVQFQRRSGYSDAQSQADAMLDAMAHRARDGRRICIDGPVALGQALTCHTPDDSLGPWQLRNDGPILTGVIRLWNADELRQLLNSPTASDHELVLMAYDRWGADFGARLEGDYALALWDRTKRRLVCLRDLFGIKPMFYRVTSEAFSCANELGAVGFLEAAEPDPVWVAEYLSGENTEPTRTGFLGVYRLEAGYRLIVTSDRLEIDQVRTLPEMPVSAPSPDDFPDALRTAISTAVAKRIDAPRPGGLLSGGLDSSSLSLLADRQIGGGYPVFSMVFPGYPTMDETAHLDAVLAAGNFAAHRIELPATGVFDDLEVALDEQHQPVQAYGLRVLRGLVAEAGAAGVSVLIDGHGGDEVIASGLNRLNELAGEGRYVEMLRGVVAAAPQYGMAASDVALILLASSAKSRLLRRIAGRMKRAQNTTAWRSLVDADLVARTGLVARVQAVHSDRPLSHGENAEYQRHRTLLSGAKIQEGFEVLDNISARHAIEPRYPFFDCDVVALCMAQPASQKFRDGLPRALLRRAMAGVLPEKVRLRRDKVNFLPSLIAGLRGDATGRVAALRRGDVTRLQGYVNLETLRDDIARLDGKGAEPDINTAAHIWRAVWLAAWLERLEASNARRIPDLRTTA